MKILISFLLLTLSMQSYGQCFGMTVLGDREMGSLVVTEESDLYFQFSGVIADSKMAEALVSFHNGVEVLLLPQNLDIALKLDELKGQEVFFTGELVRQKQGCDYFMVQSVHKIN